MMAVMIKILVVELVQPVGQPPTWGDDHDDNGDDLYDHDGHVYDEYD